MAKAVNWARYGTCPRCKALSGWACVTLSGRVGLVMNDCMRPHRGRVVTGSKPGDAS